MGVVVWCNVSCTSRKLDLFCQQVTTPEGNLCQLHYPSGNQHIPHTKLPSLKKHFHEDILVT